MAQRRMFSPEIVESEEFLSMPISCQALYFHLGMHADDDGFVQPRLIMKTVGSTEDDLSVLKSKRFILCFDSGVVVIKHWLIHNMIRLDRYKATRFIDEKNSLFIKENKAYTEIHTTGLLFGNHLAPQDRLGKVRLDKEDMSAIADGSNSKEDTFNIFWDAYPKKELKKKTLEIWNRKKYGRFLQEILVFLEKAKVTDRWKKGFIRQPPAFLNGECWTDDLSNYNDRIRSGPVAIDYNAK